VAENKHFVDRKKGCIVSENKIAVAEAVRVTPDKCTEAETVLLRITKSDRKCCGAESEHKMAINAHCKALLQR